MVKEGEIEEEIELAETINEFKRVMRAKGKSEAEIDKVMDSAFKEPTTANQSLRKYAEKVAEDK